MSPCHLFVYGTLRNVKSHPMHRLLLPATLVGLGAFQGQLYDLGDYPGAVASENAADIVRGEVYLLHEPATALSNLDRYEGQEYIRQAASIRLDTGEIIEAQIYLYNRPTRALRRIASGDYLVRGGT